MPHHYQVEPEDVLGVEGAASLQVIREAYHAQAQKYHPDHGGDAWAFRLVSWAYETMSTARVLARAVAETGSGPVPNPRPAPFRPPEAGGVDSERVRVGVHDDSADPTRVVEIEVFAIRFALDNPLDLFAASPEERILSCCLNVTWPSPEIPSPAVPDQAAGRILADLGAVFDAVAADSRTLASVRVVEDERFSGWLSYPTVVAADDAFHVLHEALNALHLSVRQLTREIFIPRERR